MKSRPAPPSASAVRPTARLLLLAVAAVAVNVALAVSFIRASAPTYDEPVHLASGYIGLATDLPSLNYRDHPPLAEMWAAAALLPLKPLTLLGDPAWGRLYHFADAFLYKNRIPADRMLNAARLWDAASWTAVLAAPLVLWAFRLAAWPGAGAAAFLLAFCPPWLSNVSLVTTDAGSAALFFLSFWLLSESERPAAWAASGAVAGLALGAKFNMIAIPPLAAAAWLTRGKLRGCGRPGARAAASWALWAACAVVALALVYRGRLPLYWEGLSDTLSRLQQGRGAFLDGRYSVDGWLWYFPFCLLIKTPVPLLLAAAAGAAAWAALPPSEAIWAALPPVGYFAAACFSRTQIGYRYILPVYPFLILAGACGAAWLWRRGAAARALCAALGLWLAASVVRAGPDYLSYFNEAAGGARAGARLLADSNLDWGQGLKELADELRRRGDPPIVLSYFGVADPAYYGIRYVPVGFVTNVDRPGWPPGLSPAPNSPVLLAVSQTNLEGVYFRDHDVFAWLRGRAPVFAAGDSLFLYDLTADADGRRRLAALLQEAGEASWAGAVAAR